MSIGIEGLPWLPAVEDGFRASVRRLRESSPFDGALARRLSTQRLDLNQLHALARALPPERMIEHTRCIRLSILSNGTTDLMWPAVVATGPRHGVWLDVGVPPFATFVSEALNSNSDTHQRRDDFILLALDERALNLKPCPGDASGAERTLERALDELRRLVDAIRGAGHAAVIVQTLAPPATSLFGSLDGRTPGTQRWMVERFNRSLSDNPLTGTLLLDVAALAETVGLDAWHDAIQWNIGKFPFAHRLVPIYAEWLCRVIAAARGKARKCLVLDLDNTLWGGVIGDDGLGGVVLGQGSAVGEAYLAVQSTALALRERGIVLAVSSKNDDAVARKMFREHPEMLLHEDHFAVFQANWQDKASNLRAIAETLDIGTDALVFVDDNPAERQQVRLAVPEVAVPELPSEPDQYAGILLSAGYFETVQFTAEDRQRADQYQANAARRTSLGESTDLGQYLESLEMHAHVSAFDAVGCPRIAQLINKTNQFNLTTRRLSEADVAKLTDDPSAVTLQVRLKDRYGDNGMVSVVICRDIDDDLAIDTWLMSCRVLKRCVEEMVLNLLVKQAVRRGKRRLLGTYLPTERNGMVREHYARLGFRPLEQAADSSHWALDVDSYTPRTVPITVHAGTGIEPVLSLA